MEKLEKENQEMKAYIDSIKMNEGMDLNAENSKLMIENSRLQNQLVQNDEVLEKYI